VLRRDRDIDVRHLEIAETCEWAAGSFFLIVPTENVFSVSSGLPEHGLTSGLITQRESTTASELQRERIDSTIFEYLEVAR